MSRYPGCGCGNYWNTPRSICGPFDEPEVRDQGRCATYRVKITCDAPDIPQPPCPDDDITISYNPGNTLHPFSITSKIFDQNCLPILDESGLPIMSVIN